MTDPGNDRQRRWERLTSEPFDVLVVGGGITGAGVARDAALRGLRVALVDKGDFASGTSSRSSRLVHGGLRYLEMYEFGLVFESTQERARLMRLAPHIVRPLPFIFPVYEGTKPGMFLMRLGMLLYDALATFRTYRNHRKLRRARLETIEPTLRRDGLKGGFCYYDCITNDGRLTLENVLGAEAAGAACLNYVRLDRALREDDLVTGAEVVDEVTGRRGVLRAPVVVNAVGPWLDDVLRRSGCVDAAGRPQGPRLQPSKGVHIVVPRRRLPVEHAVVMSGVRDRRVVFCVPWETATYVGTTDTAFDGDPDAVHADVDDIAYLLETANHFFPAQDLRPEDVISTWSGLRPLVADDEASTYQTSREHVVQADPRGVVTVAGGKLTTYRIMARQVVDAAVRLLRGRATPAGRPSIGRCRTKKAPLPGGVGIRKPKEREALLARLEASGLPAPVRDHVFRNYGARCVRILDRVAADPASSRAVVEGLPYLWAEVDLAVEEEHALRLEDVLVRRTHLFFKAGDQARGVADAVADRLAALLGWDEARRRAELDSFLALADAEMAGARTAADAAEAPPAS